MDDIEIYILKLKISSVGQHYLSIIKFLHFKYNKYTLLSRRTCITNIFLLSMN